MKETNYHCNSSTRQTPAITRPRAELCSVLKLCPKKIGYLERFLIICRIRASIRRIDAMTKVLIKSEWWNFSVHYINLNDVQFYPLYTIQHEMERDGLTFTRWVCSLQIDTFHSCCTVFYYFFFCTNSFSLKTFTSLECTNKVWVVSDTAALVTVLH